MFRTNTKELMADLSKVKSEIKKIQSEERASSTPHSYCPVEPNDGGIMDRAFSQRSDQINTGIGLYSSRFSPAKDDSNQNYLKKTQDLDKKGMAQLTDTPLCPRPPALPTGHTIASGHLLMWPAIRNLIIPFLKPEEVMWIKTYPLHWEENRDFLQYQRIPAGAASSGGMLSLTASTCSIPRVDGTLDFDAEKVWVYVASYKDHIQIMHPLIAPLRLDALVVSFLNHVGPQQPQRSIQHAIVLLVLALGRSCIARDQKLPEGTSKHGSPISRNSLSPMMAASLNKGYGNTSAFDYFAYATDILGNQFGGYELQHAQAHVLASLYYGQLGYAIASLHHLRFAGQIMIDQLEP